MSTLVITSPDPQLWRFLRLDPCAEGLVGQPVHKQECPCHLRHAKPLGLSNSLEDWLL